MKTAIVHLPATLNSLGIEQRPEPEIEPGKVKVRWHALSLNFHDYAIASGMMPTIDGRIPVSDAAGEIVAVGDGVAGLKCGDKVMSLFFPDWRDGPPNQENNACLRGDSTDGCAVEFSVVDPDSLTPMPQSYSYAEAATLPCAALTAWRGLVEICQIKAGDNVLIEGTGGVSIFALQLAKAFGATVYATSSSAEKMERLQQMGADHVINYREDTTWGETIYKLSGGVDHVIDVGGAATLEQSLAAVRMDGNVVIIGILGGLEAEINLAQWMLKQPHIRPVAVGSRAMQMDMVRYIDQGGFKPVIDSTFTLDQLKGAFEYQLSGKHFGKIVIEV